MSPAARPIAIDLFAGAGGTSLGLKQSGFDVRVSVDIDQEKAATLARNHRRTVVLGGPGTVGDVRKLAGSELTKLARLKDARLDLLVACPPCQGFSMQGNRNSADPRNQLYLEFVRLAQEMRPRAVALENVPGMLSLEGGEFVRDLINRLEALGYSTGTWRVNGADVGLPQSRQRLFVIGVEGSSPGRGPNRRKAVTTWEAISDVPSGGFKTDGQPAKVAYHVQPAGGYAHRLRGARRTVSNCELTRHSKELVDRFHALGWEEMDQPTWHRRLHPNKPAPTITAGTRTRTACRPIHPYEDRVLTVREAARLASFPDWYRFPHHTAEAWSQIGNCVPPVMAEAVFNRLRSVASL